ncbi:uncharacterized protein Z519_03610 [Cladophialophora bantiana CBS 173.52]|uniref:Uncharacterized protein n=1 Tax=Cladophialophora bantiana (strain ATCC 10958 / CBS 173.52 / CDC B-1940 / NIH 8579) TaxID=1442370 RepID=A0A0D2IE42_CLAB1|nr:uncharacterized protein Z519_03610 [Cladophialophora bantiana CBS 173.52]KIW95029.1 hypothetical protein Z519_03610 [Cladophialophora bantiana CBS 173.52]
MWSTAASWVALLALTAALTRYYNPDMFNRLTGRAFARTPQPSEGSERLPAKRQKAKRTHASRLETSNSGTSTPTSATEGKANKRRKLISAPIEDTVVVQTTEGQRVTLAQDGDDGMSNKEFAQQLAKAQAGTNLEPAKSHVTNKKERRAAAKTAQGKQNGLEASGLSTETSSTTGRDADDDLSPIGSPSSGPVSTAPTSRAGDVSDMLEAPAAKPGVLRLTDVKNGSPKATSSSSKAAFQPALTKKQRQRQAKAAERKALREESDRIHEQKKQAQLRTARMAEGSSNQTKANSFTAKQNAWQSGKPASEKLVQTTTSTEVAPLLDTFEETDIPTVTVNGSVTSEPLSDVANTVPEAASVSEVQQNIEKGKTNALGVSDREKLARPALGSRPSWADEVNEEEQDKWANELAQEEQWESVTSKKGKKKAKKDLNDTSSETSSSIARPMPNTQPVINGSQTNGVKPRVENLNRFQSIEPVTDPSFKDAEWEA